MSSPRIPPPPAGTLIRVGASGLIVLAIARTMIAFAPQALFDQDPAVFGDGTSVLGPAGNLWLSVLGLAAAALLAAGLAAGPATGAGSGPASRAGAGPARRTDRPAGLPWATMLLAAAPVPVLVMHGAGWIDDVDRAADIATGAAWLSALLGAAVLAGLVGGDDRAPRLRIQLLALLLAALAPLLVRGAMQMTVEHEQTLAQWRRNKTTFLADRGWAPDSPSARIFQRRLEQRQPRGWFATTNVFGTVAAAGAIALAGIAAGGRARRDVVIPAAAAAACGIAVVMTGSKGAVGVLGLGGGLLAIGLLVRGSAVHRDDGTDDDDPGGWRRLAARAAPLLGPGLIALALAAIAVRGMLGPDALGERSLLFRWHYLQGAAAMTAEAPALGVGPGGFQAGYLRHRPIDSPEEVSSAHSLLADWIATLGISGLAWVGLVGVLAVMAGRRLLASPVEPAEPLAEPDEHDRRWWRMTVLGATAIGVVIPLRLEVGQLDGLDLLARVLGIAAYAGGAFAIEGWLRRARPERVAVGLAAAALVVLVHVQIELTAVRPAAAAWVLALVALAAGWPGPPCRRGARVTAALAGALALACLWFAAVPASRAQGHVETAAGSLAEIAIARANDRPVDRLEEATRRRGAARFLVASAHEAWPPDPLPLAAAADQMLKAASLTDDESVFPADYRDPLEWTADVGRRAFDMGHGPAGQTAARALVMLAEQAAEAGDETGRRAHLAEAIGLVERMVERDPLGVPPLVRLGDLLVMAGRDHRAAAAYERALANDDAKRLDPLKQLPEGERRRIERMVERLGASASVPTGD